jgi:predicted enzyme related to lactoylglutathione lyase
LGARHLDDPAGLDQPADAAPPTWNSYVSVESADAAVERANELDGNVRAAAFDVMEAGRMAEIGDPQGAFFLVWQPRQHFGAALVNEPGAFCWNELNTSDPVGVIPFYGGLFGWTIEPFEGSEAPYCGSRTATPRSRSSTARR